MGVDEWTGGKNEEGRIGDYTFVRFCMKDARPL